MNGMDSDKPNPPSSRSSDPDQTDTGLVKRFSAALAGGQVSGLQAFLDQLANPPTVNVLAQLVLAEIRHRNQAGESVTLADYYELFPRLRDLEYATIQNDLLSVSTQKRDMPPTVAPGAKANAGKWNLNAGQVIDDFELLAHLGSGAFASVFLARQTSMQRLVALKVSQQLGTEPQTLAQLDHPNIVRVYDQRPAKQQDVHLLYMEYVAGGTLLDLIRSAAATPRDQWNGRLYVSAVDYAVVARGESPRHDSPIRAQLLQLDWQQTICFVGHQLADALEYARQQKVLHRDVKPANVLIGADYLPRLADFNISFCENLDGANAKSQFGGSLAYMSPEQLRAFSPIDPTTPDELDHRCDLFSLGIIMYEMLTGGHPFPAADGQLTWKDQLLKLTEQREQKIEFQSDQSVQSENEPLDVTEPRLIHAPIQTCQQPAPEQRFPTADELSTRLKIAMDPQAEHLLYAPSGHWSHWFARHFIISCAIVAGSINILGVLFIRRFNLLESLPVGDSAAIMFWQTQRVINCTAFPLATILFLFLLRQAWQTLAKRAAKLKGREVELSGKDVQRGIAKLIRSGHVLAIICAVEWIVAGLLFPVVMTLAHFSISTQGWMDFVFSHTFAGLAIMSFMFFPITYLVLRCWLPTLLQESHSPEIIGTTRDGLRFVSRLIPFYQVIAISIPWLAMALLVIFCDAEYQFALGVISLTGLLGIPFVLLISQKIQTMIGIVQRVYGSLR